MSSAKAMRTNLHSWHIQSSDQLTADGCQISTCAFNADDWYGAQVPTTILAALVQAGEYTDPYVGEDLNTIDKARFEQPWWYRCKFELTEAQAEHTTLVAFDGINHAANVYLNGQLIANSNFTGTLYQINFTPIFTKFAFLIAGAMNPAPSLFAQTIVLPASPTMYALFEITTSFVTSV